MKFNWKLGLGLILVFGIPRFLIVLRANETGNYNFTSLVFVAMILTPFILLTREGRKKIGMKLPNAVWKLGPAFLSGILISAFVYYIGHFLYQDTIYHWYVYISESYSGVLIDDFDEHRWTLFLIFALIGMTFSPIGEEFLYRGFIHQSFVEKYGENKASLIDSTAFALTHLAHFGFIYVSGVWHFAPIPALIWVLFMFLTCRVFFYWKKQTGSVYAAVLAHAGFNLGMTYFIFYHIL